MTIYKYRILILGIGLVALCRLSSAEELQGVPIPENTAVVWAVVGEGVQVYEAKSDPANGYRWSLKAPEAELKTLSGEVAGKHSGGPSWSANDGSVIIGALPPLKSLNSPDSKSIPWLLIGVRSRSGSGLLEKIDYVVRISTEGGVSPSELPKNDGETVSVKYRAIYLFLRKR
jgi:hypothetical protein